MAVAAVILWFFGAACLFLSASGLLRTLAEIQGWAKNTGDHAQSIIGGVILGLISAGIFALAALAWSAS